jgi:exodeoxyribonuclease VII large subunit
MISFSLSELTDKIQETIQNNFATAVWIRAEISELRENNNGHCYLELIEKDSDTDTILAKTKATIWSSTYRMLKPYFESSTGESLRSGLKVLVSVSVEFHGMYGFSLNIRDIEPSFTIGELAARRLKIIKQLEEDGIADMNKILEFPILPQRLAIISSKTAAGYDDFMNQLKSDVNHFSFYCKLFPAVMQGEQAESSIINALEKIYSYSEHFDLVLIIRGGGATTDLACFDSYDLALNCAQFPLPIVTGIGHQRDITILDMVAHTSVKTPTAAAEFVISKLADADNYNRSIFAQIQDIVNDTLAYEMRYLEKTQMRIAHTLRNWVVKRSYALHTNKNRLKNNIQFQTLQQKNKLNLLEKAIEIHSPAYLLKHGYTISTVNGVRLTSIHQVVKDDIIRTFVQDGDIESIA